MWWRDKCYQDGKQHNFQPRWDPSPTNLGNTTMNGDKVLALDNPKYIHDVCTWCEKVVGDKDVRQR
jgi:hypothetical protein